MSDHTLDVACHCGRIKVSVHSGTNKIAPYSDLTPISFQCLVHRNSITHYFVTMAYSVEEAI